MEREGEVKQLWTDSLQVAEQYRFSNEGRFGGGNCNFNEIVPRNEGGFRFGVCEHAIVALDDEEVNPSMRPSPDLVMGGVGRNEAERVSADRSLEMNGIWRAGECHIHVKITGDDDGGEVREVIRETVKEVDRHEGGDKLRQKGV